MNAPRLAPLSLLVALIFAVPGCGGAPQLMPTPTLYARGDVNPFLDVNPELQNNKVDVLYMTDRVPTNDSADRREYGFGRSRSVGFGVSEVRFGDGVSWDELVRASLAKERSVKLDVTVPKTVELGRFQPTPRRLFVAPDSAAAASDDAAQAAAEQAFRDLLSAHLARTRVKEVYVFVHGYANGFPDAVTTIAQLWHFFGREGVPVAYTWPAGSGGLLRGYTYDRESSEFTVFHFKQALRAIAAHPEVAKVHVIGHSRGTDVVSSAVRELHLELGGTAADAHERTRSALKLGTVVLAAPDMDLDVVIQRLSTARVGAVPERAVMYVCAQDKALGLSNWLFGGLSRVGEVRAETFAPEEIHALRASNRPQVIDARISNAGAFGHDYFHSNPAVSSDLILMMRYQLAPGAENGRPLGVNRNGFWLIDDNYPAPTPTRAAGG